MREGRGRGGGGGMEALTAKKERKASCMAPRIENFGEGRVLRPELSAGVGDALNRQKSGPECGNSTEGPDGQDLVAGVGQTRAELCRGAHDLLQLLLLSASELVHDEGFHGERQVRHVQLVDVNAVEDDPPIDLC